MKKKKEFLAVVVERKMIKVGLRQALRKDLPIAHALMIRGGVFGRSRECNQNFEEGEVRMMTMKMTRRCEEEDEEEERREGEEEMKEEMTFHQMQHQREFQCSKIRLP